MRAVAGPAGPARESRDERGTSAVEMAIIAPVVLLVMFAIIQYGYHFWALETGAASAREAARQLAVGTDVTCTRSQAVAKADAPAVGGSTPTMTVGYLTASGAASTQATPGGLVTVTVAFQSLDLGFLPMPSGAAVSEQSTARIENVPESPLSC